MFAINLSPQIIDIPGNRLDAAVEVLARAFQTYPLMRYWFADQSAAYYRALQKLFYFSCRVRLDLGYPLLGSVDAGGRLLGVAGLAAPERKSWPAGLTETYERFTAFIGPEAQQRVEQYAQIVDSHPLPQPHYYLSFIGVDPDGRGQGHARRLLDAVHAIAAAHPTSVGVGLHTEYPANVELYAHFGYRVIAQGKLGSVGTWGMFRPNPGSRIPTGQE